MNVSGVVPLLMVTSMERALAFYVDGLGFKIENRWIPDGQLRWCWTSLEGASLMLQEAVGASRERMLAAGKLGNGVGLNFQCQDALAVYRTALARGLQTAREPQVGNTLWEVSFTDPDGYSIHFASPTDLPEETLLSEVEQPI